MVRTPRKRVFAGMAVAAALLLLATAPMLALASAEPVPPQDEPIVLPTDIVAVPTAAPVTVLHPTEGQVIPAWSTVEFPVTFTRFDDGESPPLWYHVVITVPPDDPALGLPTLVEYRYNPDDSRDWVRRYPSLMVNVGLLNHTIPGLAHTVSVTPMGASEKMKIEYPGDYQPTGLSMDYYVPLAPPSKPVTFLVTTY